MNGKICIHKRNSWLDHYFELKKKQKQKKIKGVVKSLENDRYIFKTLMLSLFTDYYCEQIGKTFLLERQP